MWHSSKSHLYFHFSRVPLIPEVMDLQNEINRQRVKHIIDSYQLDHKHDSEQFSLYLEDLFERYPTPVLELALTETLVDEWLNVPMLRGCQFLEKAYGKIKRWESAEAVSTLSFEQFQQITGLSPHPLLSASEVLVA